MLVFAGVVCGGVDYAGIYQLIVVTVKFLEA